MAKIEIKVNNTQVALLNRVRQSNLSGDTYEAAIDALIATWEASHGALGSYTISMQDVGNAYGSKPGDLKYNELCDLSGNQKIDSQDQGIGTAIGLPATIVTPPPTTSTVLDELIKAVNGTPHEGLCNGSQGYSWEFHGEIQSATPGSHRGCAGWISFQENRNGNPGGLTIETRNFQSWVLSGTSTWRRIGNSFYGSQVHPHPPHEGGIVAEMGTGPNFTMPGHGLGSQAFAAQATIDPATVKGVVTLMEIKLPDSAPSNTNLLCATGADYWAVAGSPTGNAGACVGRFRIPVKGSWKWTAASSLSEAVLRAAGAPPV